MKKTIVRVRDVMNSGVNMVDGMETVAHALQTAPHPESKVFIVKKRNNDDEFGIVLLSDIAKKVLAKNKSAERVNIYEIMTKPAVHVDPEMDIRYCTRFFETFGLSRVPVVENNEVIGVIGYTDIVLQGIKENL